MEKYSQSDIEKIINDCEILFLPENTTIDKEFADTSPVFTVLAEETEDFENIYQQSKESRRTLYVRLINISNSKALTILPVLDSSANRLRLPRSGRFYVCTRRVSGKKTRSRESLTNKQNSQRPLDKFPSTNIDFDPKD